MKPTANNVSVDWLFHVGDISYADGNQVIWDEFGRQMQVWPKKKKKMLIFTFVCVNSPCFPVFRTSLFPEITKFRSSLLRTDIAFSWSKKIENEFRLFQFCLAARASPGAISQNLFWAFDCGRVRFVGIDGEGELDVPEIKPDQMQWLLNELNTSK